MHSHEDNTERAVLVKLVFFSVSLAVVPISSYFLSLKYLWNGNGIYAALTAVFTANAVLVGYIASSIMDDRQQTKVASVPPESKKDR